MGIPCSRLEIGVVYALTRPIRGWAEIPGKATYFPEGTYCLLLRMLTAPGALVPSWTVFVNGAEYIIDVVDGLFDEVGEWVTEDSGFGPKVGGVYPLAEPLKGWKRESYLGVSIDAGTLCLILEMLGAPDSRYAWCKVLVNGDILTIGMNDTTFGPVEG